MPRKSRSGRSRKRGGRSSRNPPKVYFGKNSHFHAVEDIGAPGVNTPEELLNIAAAQLADLEDLRTVDNKTGRMKKWSHKTWGGRSYILWKLFYRLKSKLSKREAQELAKDLRAITSAGHKIMEIKSREKRMERIKQVLRKVGFSDKQISELLKSTNK